jgi:hypothetical protein
LSELCNSGGAAPASPTWSWPRSSRGASSGGQDDPGLSSLSTSLFSRLSESCWVYREAIRNHRGISGTNTSEVPRASEALGTLRMAYALALEPVGDAPIISIWRRKRRTAKQGNFSRFATINRTVFSGRTYNTPIPAPKTAVARAPKSERYRTVAQNLAAQARIHLAAWASPPETMDNISAR